MIVTAPVKLVTVPPVLFCAVTSTDGLMFTPAVVMLGWNVKARLVDAAAVIVNAALVAPV
jgi:hypothetical protein